MHKNCQLYYKYGRMEVEKATGLYRGEGWQREVQERFIRGDGILPDG